MDSLHLQALYLCEVSPLKAQGLFAPAPLVAARNGLVHVQIVIQWRT